MTNKDKFDVLDIADKKEKLTDEEKEFIRKKYPRKRSRIRYGIWKHEQRNGKQIIVLIEFSISLGRRPGVDKSIDFIAEQVLSKKEYEEQLENFGCNSRIYTAHRYKNIEQVIQIDEKCGYKTPQIFINKCRKMNLTEAPNLFNQD